MLKTFWGSRDRCCLVIAHRSYWVWLDLYVIERVPLSILGKTMEGEHCAFPISVVSASTIKNSMIFVVFIAICYNVYNNWMDSFGWWAKWYHYVSCCTVLMVLLSIRILFLTCCVLQRVMLLLVSFPLRRWSILSASRSLSQLRHL